MRLQKAEKMSNCVIHLAVHEKACYNEHAVIRKEKSRKVKLEDGIE